MKETFIKLHVSILLAGATGLFGKLITLNEGLLVWYRMLLASVLFGGYLVCRGQWPRVTCRNFLRIAGVGLLLGLHWVFFYGSIKASNVSIGVVCFSLIGLFTALFEPLIFRRHVSWREIGYSLITLTGVILIFSLDMRYRWGIILGIISTTLAALFTICTKRVGKGQPSQTVLLYEMIGGFLFLSLLLPFYLHLFPVDTILPGTTDLVWLILFALFCTVILQLLQIQVLQKLSAFTVSLSYNLEPVYSIILAMIFFNEARELTFAFYLGVSFIILSVLLQMKSSYSQKEFKP